MKISKDQLKQIIKEELDDASAHTIATGGETIENPKMPTGFGHYAGKGRYEDWNTAGSGDRAREEDLESIRLAGDIGEKPEPQQRYDISDETGVPVLRSDLDDALASLSKDQLNIMIKEELAAVLHEYDRPEAPKSRYRSQTRLGRNRASMPVDQQDNPSTEVSPYSGMTPAKEADFDVAWQGGYGDAPPAPRSKGDKPIRSRYGYPELGSAEEMAATFGHKIGKALEVPKAAFDAFGRAMGKGSEPKYNHNAKSAPKVNTALETDGKSTAPATKVKRTMAEGPFDDLKSKSDDMFSDMDAGISNIKKRTPEPAAIKAVAPAIADTPAVPATPTPDPTRSMGADLFGKMDGAISTQKTPAGSGNTSIEYDKIAKDLTPKLRDELGIKDTDVFRYKGRKMQFKDLPPKGVETVFTAELEARDSKADLARRAKKRRMEENKTFDRWKKLIK